MPTSTAIHTPIKGSTRQESEEARNSKTWGVKDLARFKIKTTSTPDIPPWLQPLANWLGQSSNSMPAAFVTVCSTNIFELAN
jgi:hypothetical protein